MRCKTACGLVILLLASMSKGALAQNYTPIPVMGYNHDIITEAFPNTLYYTDTVLDATQHIMYTTSFAALSGLPAGLPNSGAIADASNLHQYQLASYGAGNAQVVMRNATRALSLAAPGSFSHISLLAFSTEGTSTINVKLKFTDGIISSYLTNYSLADWFYGNTNVVDSGFGRCQRTMAAPYGPDGYPSNPRFYYIDITLNCNDRGRLLEEVILSNVTSTGTNAPFPNAVFLALSGIPFSQNAGYTTIPATCSANNGSATLNPTGTAGPFSVSWNTNPIQNGTTVTNLAAGTYTATISDAQGCSSFVPVTIPQQGSTVLVNATASPTTICPGDSAQLSISSTGGNLVNQTWLPVNLTTTAIIVRPAVTTLYTVKGTDEFGCSFTKEITVTVNALPEAAIVNPPAICKGASASLHVQNPQQGNIYNWFTSNSGGTPLFTGISFQTPALNVNSTYYVEAVSNNGCRSINRTPVMITLLQPLAKPVVKVSKLTSSSVEFSWQAIPGASGYEITVDRGTSFQTPSSITAGTTYTIQGLVPGQSITIKIMALGVQPCENSVLSDALVVNIPGMALFVPDAFSPNGDGKNDVLKLLGNSISTMNFRVFNRWGQEVFASTDPVTGWDGRFNGKLQPDGVYIYVLKAVLINGDRYNYRGTVVLVR